MHRGKAPGAGLELDSSAKTADLSAKVVAAKTASSSLNLIAAASHEAQILFEMTQVAGDSIGLSETAWIMDTFLAAFDRDPIPLGEGLSGWVAQSGRFIVNGNATVEPTYRPDKAAVRLQSALAVPLFDLQQQVIGVLILYSAQAEGFSRDHARILQAAEA